MKKSEREYEENCTLCPRECGVNRAAGEIGFCGQTSILRAGRAALHHWEEPCLSGSRGSGTVFFSGCTLGCQFCQNYALSRGKEGVALTKERLTEIFLELQQKGAHNINLVTGSHFAPQIAISLKQAKEEGLCIPVVWNCGGYEKASTLKLLEGLVDIYLPDFKYVDDEYAKRFSTAPDYAKWATESLDEMIRQVGEPQFDEEGIMKKGVIVRHLMLPGLLYDTKCVLKLLHERYGKSIMISIMNQYTPMPQVKGDPYLDRPLPEGHDERALAYAKELGIKQGFFQEEGTVSESFIPAFNGEGILKDVEKW